MAHLAGRGAQPQAAVRLERDFFGSLELKLDSPRVSVRLDDEVVLELAGWSLAPLPSCIVVDDVDPWVNLVEADPREVRDVPAPLLRVVSDVVVASAWQTTHATASAIRVAAGHSQAYGGVSGAPARAHQHLSRRQKDGVTASSRDEGGVGRVCWFEVQGPLVGGDKASFLGTRRERLRGKQYREAGSDQQGKSTPETAI